MRTGRFCVFCWCGGTFYLCESGVESSLPEQTGFRLGLFRRWCDPLCLQRRSCRRLHCCLSKGSRWIGGTPICTRIPFSSPSCRQKESRWSITGGEVEHIIRDSHSRLHSGAIHKDQLGGRGLPGAIQNAAVLS